MILRVHVQGAVPYDVGDEIWQEPLEDAIRAEAQIIADYAGSDLLDSPDRAHRDQLREWVINEMTHALVEAGDQYRAPDGVLYSLIDDLADDDHEPVTIRVVHSTSPTVHVVLRFEQLPLGAIGSAMRSSAGAMEPKAKP